MTQSTVLLLYCPKAGFDSAIAHRGIPNSAGKVQEYGEKGAGKVAHLQKLFLFIPYSVRRLFEAAIDELEKSLKFKLNSRQKRRILLLAQVADWILVFCLCRQLAE